MPQNMMNQQPNFQNPNFPLQPNNFNPFSKFHSFCENIYSKKIDLSRCEQWTSSKLPASEEMT